LRFFKLGDTSATQDHRGGLRCYQLQASGQRCHEWHTTTVQRSGDTIAIDSVDKTQVW